MSTQEWRPSASIDRLEKRAALLRQIRDFFHERGVYEVEPPVLSRATVTDRHLASLHTELSGEHREPRRYYLQTSPEYAMKRLLASGSGAIYSLGKAFRDGEAGRLHNPEFTMLEWYRPGFDHHQLMDEVDLLLHQVLPTRLAGKSEKAGYGELFEAHLGLDPHRGSDAELAEAVEQLAPGVGELDRDTRLQLLLTHGIEPNLPEDRLTYIYDFPATQAALARTRRAGDLVLAERFEVYLGSLELANGFHELTDAAEQRRRFETDLVWRREHGLETPPIDECLIAALESGLPACAGVALGVDRLTMLATGATSVDEVLAFPFSRA